MRCGIDSARIDLALSTIRRIICDASDGGVMLKILIGVGLGFLLFTNPEARQITGDVLRAAGDAIAPQKDGRTFEDRVKETLVEKVLEEK